MCGGFFFSCGVCGEEGMRCGDASVRKTLTGLVDQMAQISLIERSGRRRIESSDPPEDAQRYPSFYCF
jgi:hypothetical protein